MMAQNSHTDISVDSCGKRDGLVICHIADVHWRGMSRHDEFREVFNDFFKKLETIKPDVIVIAGDIFHTKTQNISPEIIDHLGWWFRNMSKHATSVVVTLGNHDLNLMNKTRQDVISPILTLLNENNITLYKDSGTYPAHVRGFNWCVFSCVDEHAWDSVKPVDGDVNIALFHGSVASATNDADFVLECDVEQKFFAPFDFALLGDIHKMQFLAHRDCADGARRAWMAYPGSTIQQTFAEESSHGFLVWNIKSRDDFTVEFVELQNNHRFITLDWDGDVTKLIDIAKQYPAGARYRIRSSDMITHVEWQLLSHELRKTCGAIEVTSKIENTSIVEIAMGEMIDIVHDLRDPKTLNKLIRDFNQDVDESTFLNIEELIDKYTRQYTAIDTSVRNVKWSLNDLTFSNTFAYGEDNYIDFSALSGVTGIFAPNAFGKSSIIGTIMYTLFNATDRGPLKNVHVINSRKQKCSGSATLTVNGIKYRITRETKRVSKKNDDATVTSLDFNCIDTTVVDTNLNGLQRRDTDKLIRDNIGTAEDFLLTSLAVQGGLKTFLNEGATQRKLILSRALDLNIFEYIHDQAKQEAASLKRLITNLIIRDWTTLRDNLCNDIFDMKKKRVTVEHDMSIARNKVDKLRLKLIEIAPKNIITDVDISKQRDNVILLEEQLSTLQDSRRVLFNKIDVLKLGIKRIDDVRRNFPIKKFEEREQRRCELLQWIEAIDKSVTEDRALLEQKKYSSLKLAEVPCNESFSSCKYIRDSYRDRDDIVKIEARINGLLNELSNKRVLFESLIGTNDDSRKIKRYWRILSMHQRYTDSVLHNEYRLDVCDRDMKHVLNDLEHARGVLTDYVSQKSNVKYTHEQQRIRNDVDDLTSTIELLDAERVKCIQRVTSCEHELKVLDDEKVKYNDAVRKLNVFETLSRSTSKNGIPVHILRQLIPIINNEIAKILFGVVDFTITLDIPNDTSSSSMEIYIDYGDNKRIIELGSGMEKMIASIAIRVALINVSSLPKSDIFIIDEGFSELDDVNIDACGRLLQSLLRWFKNIIIITHIDTLKDIVNDVIDITRVGLDAHIKTNKE